MPYSESNVVYPYNQGQSVFHNAQEFQEFSGAIAEIAEGDGDEGLDSTSVIHVDEAHLALAKAGIADHKWSIEEMVDLLPEATHPNRRKIST